MVSGDLRRHPVGYVLDNVLSTLDRELLAIFLYATSMKKDDLSTRLKSNVAQWRNVASVGDDQLYETIIADEIDIMVDLAGHTTHNRLPVFSRKPAPVQVTWYGYFATTGVEAIDYILCDRWVLPPEDEGYFVETPWRLPDSYFCFTPPDFEIDVDVLPAQRDGCVTFGSFNNLTKVNGAVIACWAKLLRAVPGSLLFLKTKQLADAAMLKDVESRFAGHGVDPERLMLEGPSPRSELLASYNRVDIGLDPFPYPGGMTSVEALWMGVPVLTLRGDRFVSHFGESILHNIGLSDWIAVSHEDYVEKVAKFASDLPALSAVRKGLRERLLRSPIGDAPRFARNLEDCFRGMWREWCGRQAQDRA